MRRPPRIGKFENIVTMKEHTNKSEAASRTLDSHPKASRQASWDVILQEYAARDKRAEQGTAWGEGKAGQAKSNLEGGSKLVQRAVVNKKVDSSSPHKGAVELFFNSFDAQTLKAYQYVLKVPNLGALAELDEHTKGWRNHWTKTAEAKKFQLLPAAFGYVIETLVCHPSSPFTLTGGKGYTFIMQFPAGGTRPDVALMYGSTPIAWLDITASASAGHIFQKEGWDLKIPMYAEVTYPSLTRSDWISLYKNKDNTDETIDWATFKDKIAAQKIVYERNKAYWIQLGRENFTPKSCEEQVKREGLYWDYQYRKFIHNKLKNYFKIADIDEKMVPSILVAMRVSSTAWWYNTGFSQSVGAGEAWLTNHAPAPVGTETIG